MCSLRSELWAAEERGGVPYRTLGSTGEKVSAIGLGGYHIGQPADEDAIRIIRTAIDRLRAAGWVVSAPGIGVFVAPDPPM